MRERLALSAGSWLLTLLVFAAAGGPRISGRPWALMLGSAVGATLASSVIVWAAVSVGKSTLRRPPRVLVSASIGAPVAIFVWKVFWSARYSGALDAWITRPGFRCLGLGLAMGLFPLLAFAISRRASDPGWPILGGFAAGVAVGCVGAVLTDLWCPVAYVPHLLLGHALPVAVLGALGATLGRWVVALRPAC